jgi:hypothetical protein
MVAVSIAGSLLLTSLPAKSDLGDADITGPTGSSTTGNMFDAWCGEKRSNCKIAFINDRLVAGSGQGITQQQYRSVKKNHVCRYRSFGILDCASIDGTARYYDKEFVISYTANDGDTRTALITFRNQRVSDKFERDLEIWSQKILRPVGPSVELLQ